MKSIINQIQQQTNLSEQQCYWLVEFITHQNRTTLITTDYQLSKSEQNYVNQIIHEIAVHHKPLAYILGFVPFLDLNISIVPPILIPRPETENWVAELIQMIENSKQKNLTILDIGTGSGCIALSIAQAFPQAQIYAIDINPQALKLAKSNATNNKITNITFIESDLFSNIPNNLQFDLIVSNPPYIDPTIELDQSVTNWEDHQALFAHHQGLAIIQKIIAQTPNYLKKNNELEYQLVIEIDVTQGAIVKNLSTIFHFQKVTIKKDQFNRDRTIWCK